MRAFWKKNSYLVASAALGVVFAVFFTRCGSSTSAVTYRQIERLARPAINEGLVRGNDNLNAFNAVPPTADLTPVAAAVIADASVTLQALYAGACFINGALTVAYGGGAPQLKPAGLTCQATGLNVLNANRIGLNSAFTTAATTYVNAVAGLFLPDVMRVDTTAASGYGTLCNAGASGSPGLCGGRTLTDPVMDITFAFLLNGELAPSAVSSIRNGTFQAASTSDATCAVPGGPCTNTNNSQQGHKAVNYNAMPFSPAPY